MMTIKTYEKLKRLYYICYKKKILKEASTTGPNMINLNLGKHLSKQPILGHP